MISCTVVSWYRVPCMWKECWLLLVIFRCMQNQRSCSCRSCMEIKQSTKVLPITICTHLLEARWIVAANYYVKPTKPQEWSDLCFGRCIGELPLVKMLWQSKLPIIILLSFPNFGKSWQITTWSGKIQQIVCIIPDPKIVPNKLKKAPSIGRSSPHVGLQSRWWRGVQ